MLSKLQQWANELQLREMIRKRAWLVSNLGPNLGSDERESIRSERRI